ncbi:MAG: membrane dipeptidase [Bacteroidetes bacterium]|nr:MAG: membrane dipeptidase [Bacteroidota bacterium]
MQNLVLFYLFIILLACSGQSSEQTNDQNLDSITMIEKARQLAHKFIITDGHIDIPYRLNEVMEDVSVRTELGEFDFVRAKEGGLDAPFMSIYVPSSYQETGGAREFAEKMIDLVEEIQAQHPEKFAIARSPEEVEKLVAKGLIALPMGMENGAPIENDLSNIQYFYHRGIRYITLTHAKDNLICDSSYDTTRTWNGLSPFGSKVVREMNRVGIMVDVSHISDSAFYQVMKVSQAPAIASHSSCRHFTPGWERNMTDDMIKVLALKGGVIQIAFGSTFLDEASNTSNKEIQKHLKQWQKTRDELSEEEIKDYKHQYHREHYIYSTTSRVVDHIDRVVSLAGIDHVAFGSDFDGAGDSLPVGLKDVSQYPNIIEELLRRGYSEEDIAQICYKNVFRVWNQTAEIAVSLQQSG